MFSSLIQNDALLLLFIVAVPIVRALGALVTFFLVGALFESLDDPDALRGRIDGLFRRPPAEPRMADQRHYYRPYWSR